MHLAFHTNIGIVRLLILWIMAIYVKSSNTASHTSSIKRTIESKFLKEELSSMSRFKVMATPPSIPHKKISRAVNKTAARIDSVACQFHTLINAKTSVHQEVSQSKRGVAASSPNNTDPPTYSSIAVHFIEKSTMGSGKSMKLQESQIRYQRHTKTEPNQVILSELDPKIHAGTIQDPNLRIDATKTENPI